ncbi:MAG: His/Gly/Thr/Pro-type tRNA ligase C-terminal domain-containing protein [Pseudomonas sp.]
MRSLRRGNRQGRGQRQGRDPRRPAVRPAHRADQGRRFPAAQEQAGTRRHRQGHLQDSSSPCSNVTYADSAAIGRRYRRMDEIGTPFGITVDFETFGIGKDGEAIAPDNKFTVRDRDTLTQVRMTEEELIRFLEEKIEG